MPRASLLVALAAVIVASGLFALVVGALSLRTKGVYFIMITLAFAQMAFFVAHDTPLGGGSDGIYLYYKPALVFLRPRRSSTSRRAGHSTSRRWSSSIAVVRRSSPLLMRSRYGRALAGIKANEQRMRAAGYATYPYKLVARSCSAR